MKIIFGLFLCGLALCSCTTEDKFALVEDNQAESKTVAELIKYNKELLSNRENTRGAGRVLSTISADILGAAAGVKSGTVICGAIGAATAGTCYGFAMGVCATICGAAASYTAYSVTRGFSVNEENMNTNRIDFTEKALELIKIDPTYRINPSNVTCEIANGHNTLLGSKMQLDKTSNKYNINTSASIKPDFCFKVKTQQEKDKIKEIVYQNDFISKYNNIMINTRNYYNNNDFDYEQCIKSDSLGSTNVEKALKSYLDLFNVYPQNYAEIRKITDDYKEIINKNKEFTEEEKDIIFSAIEVAVKSAQYWNEDFQQ